MVGYYDSTCTQIWQTKLAGAKETQIKKVEAASSGKGKTLENIMKGDTARGFLKRRSCRLFSPAEIVQKRIKTNNTQVALNKSGSGEENTMARIMAECRDCKWRGRMQAHMISVTLCPKCGHPLRTSEARGKKERGAGFVGR